jgi:hypothetical protein
VPASDKVGAMQDRRETLVAACQFVGISAAGLGLPCYLIDLAFDTEFLSILAQAMLAAFACALIFAVWAHQEEWWP